MQNQELMLTGIGITSAIGQGKENFLDALLNGRSRFDIIRREGRQKKTAFLGAEISQLHGIDNFSEKVLRHASFSAQAAAVTIREAWHDAKLDSVPSSRIGLIVGGSNYQQRNLLLTQEKYRDCLHYLPPHYALYLMDTDLCGVCSMLFNIKGLYYTVGGASASGNLAIIQSAQAVLSGQVDVCIALGPVMDLSYFELQAFQSIGAMGSHRFADKPDKACRPFDRDRDGFIFGESCAAIIVESHESSFARKVIPYAKLCSSSMVFDANRNPNPSYLGEKKVIQEVLKRANLVPAQIDYINPHGTGSIVGDEIELKAIIDSNLSHAFINTTKSITGHGISSAGIVELVATLLQMKVNKLHPSLNLDSPIAPDLKWVGESHLSSETNYALNLSVGFSGINTALCIGKLKSSSIG